MLDLGNKTLSELDGAFLRLHVFRAFRTKDDSAFVANWSVLFKLEMVSTVGAVEGEQFGQHRVCIPSHQETLLEPTF